MNKYDERYQIRLAESSDIESIMDFLREHWKADHILSIDRDLFEYEFLEDNTVNMMLAIDKSTQTIEALTGFLPCSHTPDKQKFDVWGSFWKVNDSHPNMTFLGVEIMKRLIFELGCRTHLGIGINSNTTLPIRKAVFHEKTAKMKHYYCLNPQIKDFRIARIEQFPSYGHSSDAPATAYQEFFSVAEIKSLFNIEALNVTPYKDFWYINKRFFNHPYYHYHVYGLKNKQNEVRALLVTRAVTQFDRQVLRIVDYIGNQSLFAGIGSMIKNLFDEHGYEYVDFYTFGFHESYIQNAGFVEKEDNSANIIPNYFEPFVQKNIDIWVRYKDDGTLFCKADGDQDRPNLSRI